MKSEIEISDDIIKRIRKMAYRFEERYECWGMADDVFGAALEGLVRDPQPTLARTLSGAWWNMLDEMARLYGRGNHQVIYLSDVTGHDHNSISVEAIALAHLEACERLCTLNPLQRSRVLRYRDGFTMKEIAKQDGVTESAVHHTLRTIELGGDG